MLLEMPQTFYATYKELKSTTDIAKTLNLTAFYATYKELKFDDDGEIVPCTALFTLPIRN